MSFGEFRWTPGAEDRDRVFFLQCSAYNDGARDQLTIAITTAAPGTDIAPHVVAPKVVLGVVGEPLTFSVHGSDPNDEPILQWFATVDASFNLQTVSPVFPAVDTVAMFRFVPKVAGEWPMVISAHNSLIGQDSVRMMVVDPP